MSKPIALFDSHDVRIATLFTVGSVLCLAVAGCGSNLAQVSGVVTLDGEPLRGGEGIHATVFFQPATGEGASAAGTLDENGVYQLSCGSLEGIPPGEYVVTFSASEIIPSKTPGGTPTGRSISDPKYASAKTSNIRFEVQLGDNECDITLESPSNSRAGHRKR
jgi:hypothetical protein